jgi:hypothetical protein
MFAWRRVIVALGASLSISLLLLTVWKGSVVVLFARPLLASLIVLAAFGLTERWPERLPPTIARWAFRIVVVALAVPLGMVAAYSVTTGGDAVHWWRNSGRLQGFVGLTGLGTLVAPWLAMAALLRQINGEAQRQALAFELERSEFERKEGDARLRLLQAQVQPHFLFNTLANVQELVDSGLPQASEVLESLIAYLRAAIPRLEEESTTLGQELALVRAYLQVMHMRMPDRLQFELHAGDETMALSCPPMTLLTLVENAVRHGIDPSEEGGRIEVRVEVNRGSCCAEVVDTGVGFGQGTRMGTGLSNLQERLGLAFGDDARFQLLPLEPHGTRAVLTFPASRKGP